MSWSTCKYCGDKIVWAQMPGGNWLPMDPDGGGLHECLPLDRSTTSGGSTGIRASWPASAGYHHSLRELAAELGYSLLVKAYCWDCGQEIYLLARPDGGFVILDDAGPDWPVHPCYRGDRGVERSRPSGPSLLTCRPDFRVPVPAGLLESRDLHEGQHLRATIVAVEGREVVLSDGKHLYRLVLHSSGRLGECVEGEVKRRGVHWELWVSRIVKPTERE